MQGRIEKRASGERKKEHLPKKFLHHPLFTPFSPDSTSNSPIHTFDKYPLQDPDNHSHHHCTDSVDKIDHRCNWIERERFWLVRRLRVWLRDWNVVGKERVDGVDSKYREFEESLVSVHFDTSLAR